VAFDERAGPQPAHPDRALRRLEVAEQERDQRTLAGAVRAASPNTSLSPMLSVKSSTARTERPNND